MKRSRSFSLSSEQQAVVDYPAAPLRVSAGAGTGKTTTVSHRIARIVRDEGVAPDQILGLTFTNKAAQELSHRVSAVLSSSAALPGGDPLREVQVNTYHGFCSQIVAEFGALLQIERNRSIIGSAQTRQLVKQIIAEHPLPDLDNTDMFYLPGAIIRLSSSLADHLLDPDKLNVSEIEERFPQLDDSAFRYKKNLGAYQRLLTSHSKRAGMVEGARLYQAAKRDLGVVDYGDLITLAHRIIAGHPAIAQRIGGRYRAAVADEYQDTNAAQRKILQRLFGGGFPLTVVGDSDQTMYEWRGASLDNFAEFPNHFPDSQGNPAQTLHLTLNFRSGPQIIDLANLVKKEIGSRTPPLRPTPDAPVARVSAEWFPDFVQEAAWIAEQIFERAKQGRRWKDMAILFRKNKDIQGVYRHLMAQGVPVEVANLGGLLSIPEIVEIHSWLRVIGRFDDRTAAARILGGSRFRLGLGEIRKLSRFVHARSDGPPRGLLDTLEDDRFWELLTPSESDSYRRFHLEYQDLLSRCQGRTAGEAARLVMDRTGAWTDAESMSQSARLTARLNLYRFLDLAENWSPLESSSTVAGFLDYLDAIAEDPAEEADAARLSGEDAVALLTVHKAKGLEWPVVFIPAVYRNNLPSLAVGGYDNPYRSAESTPWEWRLDPPSYPLIRPDMDADTLLQVLGEVDKGVRSAHASQEWRIAYVAATRAQEELVLSGAHWYGYPEPTKRPNLPEQSTLFEIAWTFCQKLTEFRGLSQDLSERFPPGPRPATFATPTQALSVPDPHFGSGGWSGVIRQAIANPESMAEIAALEGVEEEYQSAMEEFAGLLFYLPEDQPKATSPVLTTSATGLVTYAQCPKKYFWTAVDPLPRRYSYVNRRGTQIHRQIELHHQGKVTLLEPGEETPDLTDEDRPVESEGPGPFQVFLQSRFSNMKAHWLERAFSLRLGEGSLVRGRIDAVYQNDPDTWEIVDFKSGQPPASDPHGARLAQMQVYALAVTETPELGPPPANLSVTIAYLGGGQLAENPASDPVSAAWLKSARTRLEGLVDSITAEQWDPTPSEECRKCDFFHVCPEGKTFIGSIGTKP